MNRGMHGLAFIWESELGLFSGVLYDARKQ